jgi:hypothetical protein
VAAPERSVDRSNYRHGNIIPAAPQPALPPTPRGDLTAAPAEQIVELVGQVWPGAAKTVSERRRAVRALLAYLATLPGLTWQQRWDASPYAGGSLSYRGLPNDPQARVGLGFKLLVCLRVVRPGVPGMRAVTMVGYAEAFRAAQNDPGLNALFAYIDALPAPRQHRRGRRVKWSRVRHPSVTVSRAARGHDRVVALPARCRSTLSPIGGIDQLHRQVRGSSFGRQTPHRLAMHRRGQRHSGVVHAAIWPPLAAHIEERKRYSIRVRTDSERLVNDPAEGPTRRTPWLVACPSR